MENPSEQPFKLAVIPQRERALVIGFGLLLVLQGWNLGGVRMEAEFINAFVILCLLVVALIPLRDKSSPSPLEIVRRVGGWSLFWIGLAYLGYLLVQNLNPAFHADVFSSGNHTLSNLSYNKSLPIGLDAPYRAGNGWRLLLNHTFILGAISVFYAGVSKRRSLLALGWVQIVNGTAVALWGIIQKLFGFKEVFGFVHSNNHNFFSSFIYPNHAGVFCYLTLGVLLAWLLIYLRQWGEPGVGKRIGVLIACVAILVAAIVLTYSRASWLMMLVILVTGALALFLSTRGTMRWVVMTGLLLMLALSSVLIVGLLDEGSMNNKVGGTKQLLEKIDSNPRYYVYRATWEMFSDRPVFGWGAGSYRYTFVPYQQRYIQIWDRLGDRVLSGSRILWRYAHNDWLEILAELGIVGAVLVLSWFVGFACSLLKLWHSFNVTVLLLVITMALVAVHGFFDFVRPANGVTLVFFWVGVLALKYLQWRDANIRSR